jgi:nucleoside-diphosphate-sugar epimerase
VQRKLDKEINLIVGKNGNLAGAVTRNIQDCQSIGREIFSSWGEESGTIEIEKYFATLDKRVVSVFNCAGITNTKSDPILIKKINLDLPKNLLSFCSERDIPVITFGSVMENFQQYSETNNYLKSKIALRNWLVDNFSASNLSLHIQMHTLYGGARNQPHMFLGQIFEALKNNSGFQMSAGNQIREYHHIDDDMAALQVITSRCKSGIHSISHGLPIRLNDLATHIFSSFGKEDLLSVGKLESSSFENQDVVFMVDIDLTQVEFRDTKAGVVNWMKEALGES